jgi:uncharacterized sulfatase
MRTNLLKTAIGGALWLGAVWAIAAPQPTQPNIILVLVDDLGWSDFSCFGNREAKTEHVDRLATEGLRFEQFYVNSPICSPSRVAFSTGQYPQRWRITSFLNNRANNEERGMAQWLDLRAPLLARQLRQAGYATGHFGKWHLGGQRDVGEAPLPSEYGFDESLVNFEGLGARALPLLDAHDGQPASKYSLGSENLGRGEILWEDRAKITEVFVSRAVAFIQKAQAAGKPFYVNLWPDDVHSPFFPPKERRGDGGKRTRFLGVLKTMDEQLGALFDFIRDNATLRTNTLILVCSDNGPEPGAGEAGPFRGSKGMLYEGGVRSPLIVWGPGWLNPKKAGTVDRVSFFAAVDVPPTLLALAGVQPPPDFRPDGVSVREVLLGHAESARPQPLFFRRPPDRDVFSGVDNLPDLAMRDGSWKLLCDYDGSKAQLYDLNADRAETTNLASAHPDVVQRLTAALLAWHASLPPDNGATYHLRGEAGAGKGRKRN